MDSLKVSTSFRGVISNLGDAEKGRLFDAMLEYAENGKEPQDFRGNERILWPAAKQAIDLAGKRSETNRANASKSERNEANASEPERTEAKQSESKRFTPPTVDEVNIYIKEKGYTGIDPDMFVNFYASKGWKVGNSPMKNWKACLATWNKRGGNTTPAVKQVVAQQYTQRDYTGEQEDAMSRMLRGAGLA